jgi:hypothetical protein
MVMQAERAQSYQNVTVDSSSSCQIHHIVTSTCKANFPAKKNFRSIHLLTLLFPICRSATDTRVVSLLDGIVSYSIPS